MFASDPSVLLVSRGLLLLSVDFLCTLLGLPDASVLGPVEVEEFNWCCNCWAARDVDAASIDPAAAETETADVDVEPEPPERRPFLRGGWSSDEAPVAAAFLLFLSILSPLRTRQQQAGSANGSASLPDPNPDPEQVPPTWTVPDGLGGLSRQLHKGCQSDCGSVSGSDSTR